MNLNENEIYVFTVYRDINIEEYCNYFSIKKVLAILNGRYQLENNILTDDFLGTYPKNRQLNYRYSRMHAVHQKMLSKQEKMIKFNEKKLKFSISKKAKDDGNYLFYKKLATHIIQCPFCKKQNEELDYLVPMHNKTLEDVLKEEQDNIIAYALRKDALDTPKTIIIDIMSDFWDRGEKQYFLDVFENEDGKFIYRCPSCYKVFGANNSNSSICSFDGLSVRSLSRDSDWIYSNKIPICYDIFNDEGSNTIVLSVVNKHLLPNPYGKIHCVTSNERITFNVTTGQTYAFRAISLDDKKPLQKGAPRIINITYQKYPMTGINLTDEMFINVAKAICKKKNSFLNIKDLLDYVSCSSDAMRMLCLINRYGNSYNEEFLKISLDNFEKETLKKFARMKDDSLLFEKFLRKLNVKGKVLRKMCLKNPAIAFLYVRLCSVGLTNIDCMCKYFSDLNPSLKEKVQLFSFGSILPSNNNWTYYCKIIEFIKTYCSVRPEKDFFDSLSKNVNDINFMLFKDMCYMFDRLREQKMIPENKEELKKVFKGNFKQIHDRLSLVLDQIKTRGFYIPYVKEELSVCGNVEGYSFVLAKTSDEMKDTGQKMHICVGSYDQKAFAKNCNIVFMLDSKNELAACIELREISPYEYELIQAKDYCNDRLRQEKKPALVKWLIENKIHFKDAYDSRNNQLSEINPSDEPFERATSEFIESYKIYADKNSFEKVFLDGATINWDIKPPQNVDIDNNPIPFYFD